MDPILIGGGIAALYLLLKGKSAPEPSPLQAPDIQEIVQETPPAVVEVIVQQAVDKVVEEKPQLIPTPSVVTPPRSGNLAILFKPDPAHCGMAFLTKKYPDLNFKFLRMSGDNYLEVIASTSDVEEALRILPTYTQCIEAVREVE